MNNINLSFLSGMNDVITAASLKGGTDGFSDYSGVSFGDLLKSAAAVVSPSVNAGETLSGNINGFNHLYEKIMKSDGDVKDTFRDFLNYIAMMASGGKDGPGIDFISEFALFNLIDNPDIPLDDPLMYSLLNSKSSQLNFTETYEFDSGYTVLDNDAAREATELISDLADALNEELNEESPYDEILEKLSECIKLLETDGGSDGGVINAGLMAEFLAGLYNSASLAGSNPMELESVHILENVGDMLKSIADNAEALAKSYAKQHYGDIILGSDDFNLEIPGADVKFIEVRNYEQKADDAGIAPNGFNSVNLSITDVSAQVDAINSKFSEDEDGSDAGFLTGQRFREKSVAVNQEAADSAPVFNVFKAEAVAVPDKAEVAKYIDSIETQVTEQISAKLLETSGKDGITEMTVILKPEKLGEIAVKIISEKGSVQIMLAAQNQAVGNAMTDKIASLAEGLSNQNIDVKSINIINPTEAGSQMGLDFTNQGFNRKDNTGTEKDLHQDKRISGIKIRTVDMSEQIVDIHEFINNREAKLWARA